jgi:lysozyme
MMAMFKSLWSRLFMQTSVKGVIAPSAVPDEMLIGCLGAHEGIKQFGYLDSDKNMTIGCGRCIQEGVGRGLSVDEIFYLLKNDIAYFRLQLQVYDWYKIQDQVRADALVELAFNMGISHLLEFADMLYALKRKSYPEAAKALLASKWAEQVGPIRSKDLAYRILNGRYT